VLRGADDLREVPVDHPDLTRGWWGIERDGQVMTRWTDGEAMLPLPAMRGIIMLEIHLAGSMIYAVDAAPEGVTERRAAAWRPHAFHDDCGGCALKAELPTGIEGVSSRPVRKIVLREGMKQRGLWAPELAIFCRAFSRAGSVRQVERIIILAVRGIGEELTRTPVAKGTCGLSLDGSNAAFSTLTDCLGAIHWVRWRRWANRLVNRLLRKQGRRLPCAAVRWSRR
jgi:hypothetical protein